MPTFKDYMAGAQGISEVVAGLVYTTGIEIFTQCAPLYRNFKHLDSMEILKELGDMLAMTWATGEAVPQIKDTLSKALVNMGMPAANLQNLAGLLQ